MKKSIDWELTNQDSDIDTAESTKSELTLKVVALYFQARLLYRMDDFAGCLDCLEQARQLDPLNLDILFRYILIAFDENKIALVKELYAQIISIDPTMIDEIKDITKSLLELEQKSDSVLGVAGLNVPFSWAEVVSADERSLRIALTLNSNNPEAVQRFNSFSQEKEEIRSKLGGGNNTLYKLH